MRIFAYRSTFLYGATIWGGLCRAGQWATDEGATQHLATFYNIFIIKKFVSCLKKVINSHTCQVFPILLIFYVQDSYFICFPDILIILLS